MIFPEYDSIGLSDASITNNTSNNQYLILDTLIPVYKDKKWGAYNKEGTMILSLEWDEFGYNINNVEVDGAKKVVEPILAIERCNGVVVKKEDKYGLVSLSGRELVPVAVEAIYEIPNIEDEDSKYAMLYNGEELNVIERLIAAGLIEEADDGNEEIEDTMTNTTGDTLNEAMTENNILNNNTTIQ